MLVLPANVSVQELAKQIGHSPWTVYEDFGIVTGVKTDDQPIPGVMAEVFIDEYVMGSPRNGTDEESLRTWRRKRRLTRGPVSTQPLPPRVRVYEVARELGISSSLLRLRLEGFGVATKSASSMIEGIAAQAAIQVIKDSVTKQVSEIIDLLNSGS